MIDDLLSLKAATIGRCGSHVREDYARVPNTFAADQPAQDAAIINFLRACQATQDTGQHLIHRERLGASQGIDDRAHAPRGHASRLLLRLEAKRPEFGTPRWSVGAINKEITV